MPRGSDCFAVSPSLRGEVINLSPNSNDLNINARGGDAVIFPTSKPSTRPKTESPTVGPDNSPSNPISPIVPEEPEEVERTVLGPPADDDTLLGGRFDNCLGFEVLPFPFNDSGTFLPNENECIPFVSEI